MSQKLPPQIAQWAAQAGLRQSMTAIGEAAGLPASTVSRVMRGRGTTESTNAVARVLRVTGAQLLKEVEPASFGPWEPPHPAHLLNDREREALGILILGLTEGRGTGDVAKPAQKSGDDGDGPTATVTHIRPKESQESPIAAYRGKSEGKKMKADAELLGEESQVIDDD